MAAYLSLKQNKRRLEIQGIDRYTPISNLSFFTVLQPAVVWVVWQLAHACLASDLTWFYHVKKKDSFYIVSAWARQNNFSAKSRKLGSGSSKTESWKVEKIKVQKWIKKLK